MHIDSDPNNNGNNIYKTLQDIGIIKNIDKITLSKTKVSFLDLDREIEKKFKLIWDHHPKKLKDKRLRIRSYGKVSIFYIKYKEKSYIREVYLHQPDQNLIQKFHSISNRLNFKPKISKIELAWDFFGDDLYSLQESIERHLFLTYQRSNSFNYKSTFYTNNIRKSVKGVRCYLKSKDGKEFLRMELELHRRKIKELNIKFPFTPDQLEDLDFTRFFSFKIFNIDKIPMLKKYLIKAHREYIARANTMNPQLIHRLIDSCIRMVVLEIKLMPRVEFLRKMIPNYGRFLIPMEKETQLVHSVPLKKFRRLRRRKSLL